MDELIGKAIRMDGLVDYQDGSIVSREIIKNDKGTVTVFTFDAGQGLSEHTAPFDAIVYVLDGEAKVLIDNDINLVNQGEMIIMPANKPHALEASQRFKMLLIMVRG